MKQHLVMLHGFGTDSRVFASIGTKLSKDYDVSMVDIPGHGQTRLRPEDYGGQAKEMGTFFGFSAYTIRHALDHYLKEPYHLLGWSMGGQIALEMYEQETIKKDEKCECGHDHNHKNKILSLTLISTTPKFVGTDDFKVGMNKAVFHKFRKGIEKDTDKAMDDFYTLIFPKGGDNKKLINELKTQNSGSMVLDLCMDGFEKADERRILSKVSVPTLILTGDNDEIIDPKASMYLSQEIKGSKLKICKGAGHAPFLTKEKEVIDELRTFLG